MAPTTNDRKRAPRPRGTGGSRKKPGGGYYVSVSVRGQVVTRSVFTLLGIPAKQQRPTDVQPALDKLKSEHGLFIRRGSTTGPTVTTLLDEYLRTLIVRGTDHLKTYVARERHMKAAFGDRLAESITTPILLRWAEGQKTQTVPMAPATIRDVLGHLRAAMRYAAAQDPPMLSRVPLFPKIKVDNARQAMIEPTEFEAIHPRLPERLRWASELAYVIGWRKGEVFTLTWPMISWESRLITIPKSKNRKPRMIPISPEMEAILRQAWAVRLLGCRWVFHNDGQPLKRSWSEYHWNRACEEAGIPDRRFHDLRRTSVQRMIHAGVPERVAMDISGHESMAMLYRYAIKSTKSMAEALAKPVLPPAIARGMA